MQQEQVLSLNRLKTSSFYFSLTCWCPKILKKIATVVNFQKKYLTKSETGWTTLESILKLTISLSKITDRIFKHICRGGEGLVAWSCDVGNQFILTINYLIII